MAETAPLHVQLIAKTDFITPPGVEWDTDAEGGEALVEFAGRACYQSWSKPNPKYRDQCRLSAAHHRRRSFLGARARPVLGLHHWDLAITVPTS